MSLPSTPSRATPVPRVGHIQPGYRSPPLPNPLPHRSPSSNTSPPTRIGLLSSPSEASRTLIPISLGSGQGNQPHLVSLVLQSKKALQHGEQLCARAHTESNASAQAAVDILTLDAKVKWLVEAVVEQLKLAAGVAKRIEEKRAHIQKEVEEWDTTREKHTDALETVLESLGSQLVPPEFHQTSADSSLFGSQHGSDNEEETNSGGLVSGPSPFFVASKSPPSPLANQIQNGAVKSYNTTKARLSTSPVSPSVTLRRGESVRKLAADLHGNVGPMNPKGKGKLTSSDPQVEKEDRRYWKSLRDFVDDQGIEDTLDTIERDRLLLDDILSKTDDYPETLTKTINSIQASLPEFKPDEPGTLKQVQGTISAQEHLARSMASALMSLASHYDNMATALKESENGEAFTDKELQVMNRDTEELRAIMLEMEADMKAIEGHYEHAKKSKHNLDKDLEHLAGVLDKLDELGEIMEEMLQTQDSVEIQAEGSLNGLEEHLTTLGHFHEQFVSYRMAFNKLMLEIARRRQYREAAEDFVRGVVRQLDSMTEEESRVRTHFNDEYGSHLPEDICLCIGNAPTKWEVVPWDGTSSEVLPFIANDLIAAARERVGYSPKLAGHDNL